MKKFNKAKYFLIGFFSALLMTVLFITVFSTSIETIFNGINININGKQFAVIEQSYTLADGREVPFSIIYNETTYLPIRKIAEAVDYDVEWDGKTSTATLNKKQTDDNQFDYENKYQKEGAVMVYTIDESIYREFIVNPNKQTLDTENINTEIHTYNKSKQKIGYIERKCINGESLDIVEVPSGYMRIGYIPVDEEFVDFINSKENIRQIFLSNNIKCNITNYLLIEYLCPEAIKIPITIWIETDIGNYFITIEVDLNNLYGDYIYSVYTHNEYYEKFRLKEGTLIINGKDVTEGNYVKFENKSVYLPFYTVMENLGAEVDWDEKNKTYLFSCNGKDYVLDTNNEFSLTEVGEKNNILLPPPGGSYFCQYIDGVLIMDNYTMQVIVNLMDAVININYNELIVNIDSCPLQ